MTDGWREGGRDGLPDGWVEGGRVAGYQVGGRVGGWMGGWMHRPGEQTFEWVARRTDWGTNERPDVCSDGCTDIVVRPRRLIKGVGRGLSDMWLNGTSVQRSSKEGQEETIPLYKENKNKRKRKN